MKQYPVKKFIQILGKNGFEFDHQNGSHAVYKRGTETICLPMRKLNCCIAARLIKEHHLVTK